LEKSPSRRRVSPSGEDTPRWGTTNTSVQAHAPVPNQDTEGSQPSCDGRPDGSLPAFAWSNVSTPIRTITARRSLFPSSHTRTINSVPRGSPASQLYWQPYGLTTFPACHTTDLGSTSSPAVQQRRNPNFQRVNRLHTILVDAAQQLRHRYNHGVYQQFTYINHISQPSSLTPSLLGVSICAPHDAHLPELPGATLSEELHTPPLPVTHVFLGYC